MIRALIKYIFSSIIKDLPTKKSRRFWKKLHALLDANTADDNFICAFYIEAVSRGIRYVNPLKVQEKIEGVAKHEAYHILQILYVFEHGSAEGLDKLFADVNQCDYWDNVLEKGAYLYQWLDIHQDFDRDFAPYIRSVCA